MKQGIHMTEDNTQLSFDVITELKNAIQIIDHACEQGAFKGWGPINQVLGCRGRLLAFIELMEKTLSPEGEETSDIVEDGTAEVTDLPVAPPVEETVEPETAPPLAQDFYTPPVYDAPVEEFIPDEPSTTSTPVTPEPAPVDTRIDEELSQIQQRREELARAMADLDSQASVLSGSTPTA
jgi:hypothetical protein